MPKYNLMDNEDLERKEPAEKSEPDAEQPKDKEPKDSAVSDFILDDLSISDPDIKPPEEDEYNIPPAVTTENEKRQPTPPMQPFQLDGDYQDEKQPGMNFKPIILIAAALVVVVLGYLAIDHFFLSGTSEETTEQVETPEERLAREQQEQKQCFLGQLNSEKQARMRYLTNLITIKPGEVKYSSFLLYTNTLSVEAFAKDRSGLAKLNMQLKSNPSLAGYTLESAVNRPGSSGGVFALYNYQKLPSSAGSSASAGNIPAMDAAAWRDQTARQFGLQVSSQRQISSSREQMFTVSRYEYIFKGSESACFDLMKSMAGTAGNYTIHKLLIVPTDQKHILKSNYQMTLIMDFYL